jgi:hypothetical protein
MSAGLQKATLQEVRNGDGDVEPVEGTELEVQFNPESLRLTHRNQVEGGESRARQVRQHVGRSSTELSFDLVFDTADEIREDGTARDVRERTAMVERFLIPKTENGERKPAPPRVRFHWGELVLVGVITSLSIDFDLFSPDGTPLRAKTSVSIQEQDPRYEFLEAGAGAARESASGGSGSGRPGEPGSDAGGDPDRTESAQEGESLADFATRQGLDPSRWRALAQANGVDDPRSLPAGVELSFDSTLSAGMGVGTRTGPTARGGAGLEAELGLADGAGASLARGRALAQAGGLAAALDAAAGADVAARAQAERDAFAKTGAGAERPGAGADARARTFGRGVPLRPLRGGPDADPAPLLGSPRAGGQGGARPAPLRDPARPSWEEDV